MMESASVTLDTEAAIALKNIALIIATEMVFASMLRACATLWTLTQPSMDRSFLVLHANRRLARMTVTPSQTMASAMPKMVHANAENCSVASIVVKRSVLKCATSMVVA